MNICLILDNPETPNHPVIGTMLQQLQERHSVRLLDVRPLTSAQVIAEEERHPLADLYLLKSHAPQAVELAHELEGRGALVVNSWASTLACQNRVLMAERMHAAQLPWPRTWSFTTLGDLLRQPDVLATFTFPLIIKSAYSHRGDLVQKLHSAADIEALNARWASEPVVLQAFARGDGWDQKLWVIDGHLYAARRRTALEVGASATDVPLADVPAEWHQIALEIGRVFDLHLYGLDLVLTDHGPVVVDVNGFPGFRGWPDAASLLVSLVERLLLR